MSNAAADHKSGLEIAIIGMAGRFPGAKNIEEFWQNLKDGKESITFFPDQELLSLGVDSTVLNDPNYVKAAGVVEDLGSFDASFFGYYPREAEIIDPQHRIFLECGWEALENAGYNSETYSGLIGVYAGTSTSSYLPYLLRNEEIKASVDAFQLKVANDNDYVSTRLSYKLNLKGPSLTIQTACSTSLVAVHVACQGLLSGDCDIALAGGVSINMRESMGYFYQEGGILSPDGHCRAFDAKAQGTVGGSGAGVVILKRLEDALADGDYIHAVIKGSAINNDGSMKVGYTAPSVDGQMKAIRTAHLMAGIEPRTVTYVEAHGTGTIVGDPIELAALTQAFRASTQAKGFCAIGSVKTNIGHLDAAAGVAGFIKTVLALEHKMLPPSLHFEQPNPGIDFENSPFYVNSTLSQWKASETPRRAGVSSFGIGGTNAHVLLEEAPAPAMSEKSRPKHLLVVSAKTASALESATTNLLEYFKQHPDIDIADVAYTLQVGRREFNHRSVLVCQSTSDCVKVLGTRDPQRVLTTVQEARNRPVIFMFPGGGAQYGSMGAELYQVEPVFREQIDRCAGLLKPHLGLDIRNLLYAEEELAEGVSQCLPQPSLALPALFVTEYALAKLWISWGVYPKAMIGHSLGEYVAACLAEVISLEDALSLVTLRGRLFEQLPKGAMLSVPLSEKELLPLLGKSLSLAAINGVTFCVASGPIEDIGELEKVLADKGVVARQLPIAVAAHSKLVTPILKAFRMFLETLDLHPPCIPYISNVTGAWITPAEATDPDYWVKHLRQTVRFAEGIQELLRDPEQILLEVGPGKTLSTLAKLYPAKATERVILTSLRHPHEPLSDVAWLLTTLGRLWLVGVQIHWQGLYVHEKRLRIPLPTYPFERQRYWIEPQRVTDEAPIRRAPISTAERQSSIPRQTDKEHAKDTEHSTKTPSLSLHPRPHMQNTYVSPRDDVERIIANTWQSLLGIEQVGVHDNFFELGGHSLLATQLISQLRKIFQVEIPMRILLGAPTVAEFAQTVNTISQEGTSAAGVRTGAITDLNAEVVLDPTITAETALLPPVTEPTSILLTGAAGFVGAFVLQELLTQTQADIYCLIRSFHPEQGKQKIQRRLESCLLWDEKFSQRIIPVVGDLSQPHLGLSDQQFQVMANEIDVIYHCGAQVHFSYPYHVLKPANVLGTEEILRLASQVKMKPVHHISSISVFSTAGYSEVEVIGEDDMPDHSESFLTGYAQSKWVAEKLAVLARSRGLPVSIYRLGAVAGDSKTGICNTNDAVWRVIKGCIQLGSIPGRDTMEYITPADYVSKAIVHLSRRKESLGKTFHLVANTPTRALFDWIRSFGYPLQQISYDRWRAKLIHVAERSPENALYPLVPLITESFEIQAKPLRFDSQNTRATLADSPIVCPAVDAELLRVYLSYFIRCGFLEAPRSDSEPVHFMKEPFDGTSW